MIILIDNFMQFVDLMGLRGRFEKMSILYYTLIITNFMIYLALLIELSIFHSSQN